MNKEFSKVNRERCESTEGFNHSLHSWSLSDWAVAMMGEFGEALNNIKKLNRLRDGMNANFNKGLDKYDLQTKLRQEIADGYIYLDLLCQFEGIDLEEIVKETFNNKSDEIGCKIKWE